MSRHANPTLIGVFVIGAIVLATTVILLLGGGEWFTERRKHIVYFEGEAQGLQTGAPVMLLGVKIGTVKRIQLGLDEKTGQLFVPVIVEIEPQVVLTRTGTKVDLRQADTINGLVQRGLRARLRMQSFLTGQLYVDLDFHPARPARYVGLGGKYNEIPAIPTATKELAASLEDFPMQHFLANVSAIGASVNAILSTRAAQNLPGQLAATLQHLESLVSRLDQKSEPILEEVRVDLVEARKALLAVQSAMARLESAAGKVGDLAGTEPGVMKNLSAASVELADAAQAVSNLTHEESPTLHNLDSALKEISRAAQALRLLAETLEQQPEAVLRGKRQQEQR